MKASHRTLGSLVLIVVILALSLTCVHFRVFAGTGISTSAMFRDDTAVPDRIRSDGAGPYVNGQHNVKAIIDGQGDFDLDTSASGSGTRTLFVDLTSPTST